jgi:spermidine synthase
LGLPALAAAAAVLLLTANGPTAVWRHSPIGAGRVRFTEATRNSLRDWANGRRRVIEWATDGVESSVALDGGDGWTFVVNGKSDGNVRHDASTQVMGGLVGAILHPKPARALVIGLGTGSTAGWLGVIPTMERVDVAELEPAILEVARVSTAVNQNVLANPKVHVFIGDAREVLLTTPQRYDIIFSEPSNPYRAGIASLFTREFYRAVSERLAEGGIFLQWLQAYEVDGQTIRTAYATLAAVFPVVETWHTHPNDLLLVASLQPITYDVPALRARVAQEPYKSALARAWRASGLEGFLAHYVARPSLARTVAESEREFLNTDDRTPVEFAFARSVGRAKLFETDELRDTARTRGEHLPEVSGGDVDWAAVEDARIAAFTADDIAPNQKPHFTADQRNRAAAQAHFIKGDLDAALKAWRAQPREPAGPVELAVVGAAVASQPDEAAVSYIDQLRAFQPVEADAILGLLRWRQTRPQEAAEALVAAFKGYHEDPWPMTILMGRTLELAGRVAAHDHAVGQRLYDVLKSPFAVHVLNDDRKTRALMIAAALDFKRLCAEALEPLEPYVPWNREFLANRARCYRDTGHPRATQAMEELTAFLREEPVSFAYGLATPPAAGHSESTP